MCASIAEAGLVVGGVVVDASTGAALTGATVALFDDSGDVVGTDLTDGDGTWAIETEWKHAHLKAPSSGGSLFSSLIGVVTWPVRTTARFVGGSTKALFKGAARAAGGAAVAGVSVAAVSGAGPVAEAAVGQIGRTVGRAASDAVVGALDDDSPEDERSDQMRNSDPQPGEVTVRVWKQGAKDYHGRVSVYALERFRDENGHSKAAATVDPVLLASEESGGVSSAPRHFGILNHVSADPMIVEAGATVRLSCQMPLPDEMLSSTCVVAWDLSTRQRQSLTRTEEGAWQGEMELPKKGPYRNHEITIVAYRNLDQKAGGDEKLEARLWDKDAWNPRKAYPVDPVLLVSRNRGQVTVTVIKPPRP